MEKRRRRYLCRAIGIDPSVNWTNQHCELHTTLWGSMEAPHKPRGSFKNCRGHRRHARQGVKVRSGWNDRDTSDRKGWFQTGREHSKAKRETWIGLQIGHALLVDVKHAGLNSLFLGKRHWGLKTGLDVYKLDSNGSEKRISYVGVQVHTQLTLEQHGFELHDSTYTWISSV